MIERVYTEYLSLVDIFRQRNTIAFNKAQEWTYHYLINLVAIPKSSSLEDYAKWRVIDGGIMCPLWHNLMFAGPDAPDVPNVFMLTALLASYHNDILSFDRDVADETPNLVHVMREHGMSNWDAFQKAIAFVDDALVELVDKVSSLSPHCVKDVFSRLILGTYGWGTTEPRYEKGVALLVFSRNGDIAGFNAALGEKYVSAHGEMSDVKV